MVPRLPEGPSTGAAHRPQHAIPQPAARTATILGFHGLMVLPEIECTLRMPYLRQISKTDEPASWARMVVLWLVLNVFSLIIPKVQNRLNNRIGPQGILQ